MELQPPNKRAAQALGVLMIVVGAVPCFFPFVVMLNVPGPDPITLGFLAFGAALVFTGVKLLRWGSGKASSAEDSPP